MAKIELKYLFETEDELRAHLGGEIRTVEAPVTPEAQDEPPAATQESREADAIADYVDADGMPWNEEYHASTKTKNADGTWKARQGKAQAAKDARAAFKAQGGDVEAPAAATLPGAEETKAAPSLPGADALPADAPEPVSWDQMVEKITGMSGRGVLSQEKMMDLYKTHGGDNPVETLEVNESARAALFADLLKIEPEL